MGYGKPWLKATSKKWWTLFWVVYVETISFGLHEDFDS
jgi:hypothetical protein